MINIRNKNNHNWKFARVGGIDRVCIDSGADLINLEYLDQKLWTALSCPIYGLELDSKTLQLMDTDGDSRLRVPEIIAAIKWISSVLKSPDILINAGNEFPLSAINEQNPEGLKLLQSAKQILQNLGKVDSQTITVEDTSDTVQIFASTKFNGDGIIVDDSVDNDNQRNLLNNIIRCCGSETDRSGKQGVTSDLINAFFESCEAYSKWFEIAEKNADTVLPFGDSTKDAYTVFENLKSKIDDYFVRCKLAAFDTRSADALNLLISRYEVISAKDLSQCNDEISSFPIAFVDANKPLPLNSSLNPAWEKQILQFNQLVINPLFGKKEQLSESEWNAVISKFSSYKEWINSKAGINVECLGIETIREYLSGTEKENLLQFVEKDKALEGEANSIALVDKLVRYYRDLYTLLKNFVSFNDFYSPDTNAIFQAGTLYIDRKSCDLCILVNDIGKHSSFASSSKMCLLYCECVSKTKNQKINIAAAVTNGDIDNLAVGRNGVFYDRQGNDWDATIVKIVENPVSIRQAFWSPYKSVGKMIGGQIEKFASAKEKQMQADAVAKIETTSAKLESVAKPADSAAKPASQAAPVPSQAFDIGKFVGIFAAIGLALGAIGSTLLAIFSGFFKLSWWQMPLAILGLMLAISGPSMLIAYLKLRVRNLAPVLDANGWAINARAIINIRFGRTLTSVASLPLNSTRNLKDPYSKKNYSIWIVLLIIAVIVAACIYLACHNGWIQCLVFH